MTFQTWFLHSPALARLVFIALATSVAKPFTSAVDVTELVLNSFDFTIGKEPVTYWNTSVTEGSSINVEYVLNPTVHGNGSARIDFTVEQADASGGRLSWMHISEVKYDLAGGDQLSFWYHVQTPASLPDRTILQFTLFDGAGTSCTGQCKPEALEHYSWSVTTVSSDAGWQHVLLNLTTASNYLDTSTGTVDNQVFDAAEIFGFSFDFILDGVGAIGSTTTGSLNIDGLMVTGPEVLNHLWSSQAWIDERVIREDPLTGWKCEERGLWMKTIETTYGTQQTNLSSHVDADGKYQYLDIEYAAEESASWGGFTMIEQVLPNIAYYNLSKAEQVAFDLNVIDVASEPGHVHLRLILFDAVNITDFAWERMYAEHYYSFYQVLDDATDGWTTIRANLTGSTDSSDPFWFTGWSGSGIDYTLSKEAIKGFQFIFAVDASGNMNSKYHGKVQLGNLQAPSESVNIEEQEAGADGVEESEVIFDIFNDENVTIVSFMTEWQDCAQSCMDSAKCNYWSHKPVQVVTNCALINKVSPGQIIKKTSSDEITSGWVSTRQPVACGDEGVCACTETTIDCSGGGRRLASGSAALTIFPDLSTVDTTLLQSINIANTSISFLSANMLGGLENLQALNLGSSVSWFSSSALLTLPGLQQLQAESLTQMIQDPETEFFDEVCCNLGTAYSIGDQTWYGCNYQDEPVTCATEDFVTYSVSTDDLGSFNEGHAKFGWGAASAEECCQLCSMYSGCKYWTFDNRWTISSNLCTLKTSSVGRKETHNWYDLACDLSKLEWCFDHQDQLDPGYVSGYVASVQAALGEVGVSIVVSQAALRVDDDCTTTYEVTVTGLGSGRGAVWVTPKLVDEMDGVEIYPASLPFYNGQAMTKTIQVRAAIPAADGSAVNIELTHTVEGCDLAWDYLSEGSNITKKFVVVPRSCPAGMYLPAGATECAKCFKGAYCPGGEGEEADPRACQAKTYNPEAGSMSPTACIACPAGTFSKSLGASNCEQCSLGRYSDAEDGASSCDACPQGSYASQVGLTKCISCPSGMLTLSQGAESSDACGCAAGTFSINGSNTCYPCTEGSSCAGMDAQPQALETYKIHEINNGRLRIFSCGGDHDRCPGGPVGTCASGRSGYTCSDCAQGMRQAADGTCTPCSGSDKALFVCICILGFMLSIVAYLEIAKAAGKQVSKARLTGITLIGLFVFSAQVLAALSSLNIEWTDPVRSTVESASLIGFNLDIIYAPCWEGFTPVTKYASAVICVIICLVLIAGTHRFKSYLLKRQGKVPDNSPLFNTYGNLMQALYVTIVMTLLSPLFCTSHPSGESTIATRPSVLCWQGGDHTTMLVLGIFSSAIPISYLATVMHATWRYPRAMAEADLHFRKNFQFFFHKFRPRVYWYPCWIVVRNWLITFSLIPSDTLAQLLNLQAVMVGSVLMALKMAPYHKTIANVIECVQLIALMSLLCIGQAMVGIADETAITLAAFALILALSSVPALILLGIQTLWRQQKKKYQFFLCNHTGSSASFVRLLKMHLGQSAYLHADNPLDLDLSVDLVAFQASRFILLVTDPVFSNLNCLAEMTTARVEHVPVTVVTLPGVIMPSGSFVEELPFRVANLVWLQTLGMTIATVQQAVSEVLTLPILKMMPRLTSTTVLNLRSHLMQTVVTDSVVPMGQEDTLRDTNQLFILADTFDWCAMSAAHVLASLVWGCFKWEAGKNPEVLPHHQVLPNTAGICLLVCTPGILGHVVMLDSLMVVRSQQLSCYPVLIDDAFVIPSRSTYHEIKGNMARIHRSADAIMETYFALFLDATMEFPIDCGLPVLEARAEIIARRIQRRLLKGPGAGSGSSITTLMKVNIGNLKPPDEPPSESNENLPAGPFSFDVDRDSLRALTSPRAPPVPTTFDSDLDTLDQAFDGKSELQKVSDQCQWV